MYIMYVKMDTCNVMIHTTHTNRKTFDVIEYDTKHYHNMTQTNRTKQNNNMCYSNYEIA